MHREVFGLKNIIQMKEKCTRGGSRTPTVLPPVDFESTASTNSATLAGF